MFAAGSEGGSHAFGTRQSSSRTLITPGLVCYHMKQSETDLARMRETTYREHCSAYGNTSLMSSLRAASQRGEPINATVSLGAGSVPRVPGNGFSTVVVVDEVGD